MRLLKASIFLLLMPLIGCSPGAQELEKIVYPSSLDLISGSSLDNFKSEYKIIHYIDFGCSDCIAELEEWKGLIEKHDFKEDNLLFVIRTDDVKYAEYLIKERIRLRHTFYVDKDDGYFLNNINTYDKSLYTLLVDNKDRILLRGNPVKSNKSLNEYLNQISGL